MRFTKMHGCGNAYIYVDCRPGRGDEVSDPTAMAARVSDRHKGIGSDGLILVQPSEVAGARMEMYNADGSRGAMCGNGIRCFGKLLFDTDPALGATLAGPLPPAQLAQRLRGDAGSPAPTATRAALADALEVAEWFGATEVTVKSVDVETDAGVKRLYGFVQDGAVNTLMADVGSVSLRLADMDCTLEGGEGVDRAVEVGGQTHRLTCVLVGSLHAVVFVDDLESVPLETVGPVLERAPVFPDRVNVHFVQVLTPDTVRMRIWERGSGATPACGTGACAAVAAAAATGRTGSYCGVVQPGGWLTVHLSERSTLLTGPAETICRGEWVPSLP